MSDCRDDGGNAFPTPKRDGYGGISVVTFAPGMSLRDYFAAKAMQAAALQYFKGYSPSSPADIASKAYDIADAMLRARSTV